MQPKKKADAKRKNVPKTMVKKAKAIQRAAPAAIRPQLNALSNPLTHQDSAILGYLTTVADPWVKQPTGVPLILGSGGVVTLKSAINRLISVQCNASGFGFAMMCMDGWIGPDDDVVPDGSYAYASYNGGTPGNDLWYSSGTFVGTTVPNVGATTATTGLLASAHPLIDQSFTNTTQFRLVAAGMRAYSDANALNQQGSVYVISTSEPVGTAATGSIIGLTEAQLTLDNEEIVGRSRTTLAGLSTGRVLSTSAVPSTASAFDFHNPPAAGSTAVGFPQIAVIIVGAAANQVVKVETVKIYEFEKNNDNRVGDLPEPTLNAPTDRITSGLSHLTKLGPVHGPASVHEATGIHSGKGMQAFVNEVRESNPTKLLSLSKEIAKPSVNWGATAGHALNFASKIAKNYLPGWVTNAASALASTFLC